MRLFDQLNSMKKYLATYTNGKLVFLLSQIRQTKQTKKNLKQRASSSLDYFQKYRTSSTPVMIKNIRTELLKLYLKIYKNTLKNELFYTSIIRVTRFVIPEETCFEEFLEDDKDNM